MGLSFRYLASWGRFGFCGEAPCATLGGMMGFVTNKTRLLLPPLLLLLLLLMMMFVLLLLLLIVLLLLLLLLLLVKFTSELVKLLLW